MKKENQLKEEKQTQIYKKLYSLGKIFNETTKIEYLNKSAVEFVTNELNFEKALFFEHNIENGWFYVVESRGYNTKHEQNILNIISLLLSGEIIEYLRISKEPIIHTKNNYKNDVVNFLKALFLEEAYIELIGGDINIPHGVLIAGNTSIDSGYTNPELDDMVMLALGNFTIQFSNTINNIIFYDNWKKEKFYLEENIQNRTKIIQEQKDQFEAIYITSKDGIALIDVETTAFLDVNPAYSEITGFTKEELLRTSCLKLSVPEDLEKSKEALAQVKEEGFLKDFIKRCINKDASIIITNMNLALMPDKQRILVTIKDVSELKKQEKLINEQSKMASMGEMIGNIAHQWRQPLSVITAGVSGILLDYELNKELDHKMTQNTLNKILDQSNYLSKTVDDFRDFTIADNSKKTFLLEKTISTFLNLIQTTSNKYSINIEIDIEKNCMIKSYPNEFIQSMINIFNNSKDAFINKNIDEDKRYFYIKSEVLEDKLTIIFRDTAGGIKEEYLSKIFEPYFTTKHQSVGTGLGLHMTYNLITNYINGKIEVSNISIELDKTKVKGFEFKIILPN